MRSGSCPKCKEQQVYYQEKPLKNPRSVVGISSFGQARLQTYICTSCGYVEEYIHDNDDMLRIREKWTQVV